VQYILFHFFFFFFFLSTGNYRTVLRAEAASSLPARNSREVLKEFLHSGKSGNLFKSDACETLSQKKKKYQELSTNNLNCSEILQEILLNSVSNDLLPFAVGQSHGSFTLLSVRDVMLFQYCQQAIRAVHELQTGEI
jgi:hypothetical protein